MEEILKLLKSRKDILKFSTIPASSLIIKQWVRDACSECQYKGRSWSCPPECPTISEAKERVASFKKALVVLFKESRDRKALERAVLEIERKLKELGYPETIGFFVSPCTACGECRYPEECPEEEKCRPTGECWGIDLIATADKAGIGVRIVAKGEDFEPVTLFLLR